MTRQNQEVWGDYTRDPKVVERKGDQVQWFAEQICDNGKRTSYSKQGLQGVQLKET